MKIKYLVLIGTGLTLAAASGVAIAQSSDTGGKNNPSDIKLSPAAQTILCKQFPLNSRCADNAGKPGSGASGSTPSPSPAPSGSEAPSPAPSGGSEMSPSPAPNGSEAPSPSPSST